MNVINNIDYIDISEFYTNIHNGRCGVMCDMKTLINKIILCEELKLYKQRKYLHDTALFRLSPTCLSNILQYMRSVFIRCKTLEMREKRHTIISMRCVVQYYILIFKMGGCNIVLTNTPLELQCENVRLSPIICHTEHTYELNIYVVENYIKKLIRSLGLSAYDITGVIIYMKRLLQHSYDTNSWYFFDSCVYIIPTLIILYRKLYGLDGLCNYNNKCATCMSLDKKQLGHVEIQIILDIPLFIDSSDSEMLISKMTRDLRLVC